MRSRKKEISQVRIGDSANDPDFRFSAGRVVAVCTTWFMVEWERCGITYWKRHYQDVLDAGQLVVWS